jgi:hypothetical protein
VGTHRRISAAPASPSANAPEVQTGGRTTRVRRAAPLAVARDARSTVSLIGRPVDPSPRAVKGARRQFPLRSSGLRGVAARIPVAAAPNFLAPICLRTGHNGQRASRGLYIGNSHGMAEPRHAPAALTVLSRQAASHTPEGATLGQGGIPMSQIAPAVGTAPARRLRRPAAGGCGSEQFMGGALLASRAGALDRRANPSHHPATVAIARSRSALATSNHSDMAAH